MYDEELFNIPGNIYESTKNEFRKNYEKRLNEYTNKSEYKKEMTNLMKKASKEISFETDIGQDDYKKYAFTETLRQIYKMPKNSKAIVKATALDGTGRYFTLSDKHNFESTLGHITGEIDLTQDQSDTNPYISYAFVPVKYEVLFLKQTKDEDGGVVFTARRENPNTDEYTEDIVEVDDAFRNTPEGSFFPYTNLSPVDLSHFQIFHTVEKENYRDNCFVYACIQSKVFSKEEIEHLRYFVEGKSIPSNKIKEIAKKFKCNFVVSRIIEQPNRLKHEVRINTKKKEWGKSFNREVRLILYKEHYMINEDIPCTCFYLKNFKELDEKFPHTPFEKRCMIKRLDKNRNHIHEYAKVNTTPIKFFKTMFKLKLFKMIPSHMRASF